MAYLRCTKKLLKQIGLDAAVRAREDGSMETDDDWYAYLKWLEGRKCVLFTNVGTFRVYVEAYLSSHPKIDKKMTFLVRQLAPSEHGLPIEIYVFSSEQDWVRYEGLQADIFDHLLAVAPLFDLRVFQRPSGADLRVLSSAAC